jgi:FkbM family methyltransferase
MTLKSRMRAAFRRLGWEVRRVENANLEQETVKDILRLTGVAIVLDVGANIGQFGDLVLEAGFKGLLVSFEAIPEVHQRLAEHAARRGGSASWIVAPCAALGSASGQVAINIAANSVSSSLLPMRSTHVDAAPQSKYIGQQTLRMERLDSLSEGLIPRNGGLFVKIDTQGYELEVLKGATQLLHRTMAVQLELSLTPLYEGAPTLMEMLSFMESQGYELFGFVPGFKNQASGRLLQMDGFFVRP